MRDQLRDDPYEVGDRVRIDIPDETHPEHRHHGKNGEIIAVIPDSAQAAPESGPSAGRYRVELDADGTVDVRARYVRPPI